MTLGSLFTSAEPGFLVCKDGILTGVPSLLLNPHAHKSGKHRTLVLVLEKHKACSPLEVLTSSAVKNFSFFLLVWPNKPFPFNTSEPWHSKGQVAGKRAVHGRLIAASLGEGTVFSRPQQLPPRSRPRGTGSSGPPPERDGLSLSRAVFPIKVPCLGRTSTPRGNHCGRGTGAQHPAGTEPSGSSEQDRSPKRERWVHTCVGGTDREEEGRLSPEHLKVTSSWTSSGHFHQQVQQGFCSHPFPNPVHHVAPHPPPKPGGTPDCTQPSATSLPPAGQVHLRTGILPHPPRPRPRPRPQPPHRTTTQ